MKKLIALVFVAMLFAACSPDSIAENIIESQDGSGDIDVDIDSDDGTIEVTGEDGEVATFGGGEIPDDFPFPLPEGGDVQSVVSTSDGSSVSMFYPDDDFESLVDFFRNIFESESAGDPDAAEFTSSNPPSASFAWNTSSGGLKSISATQAGDQTVVTFLYGDS